MKFAIISINSDARRWWFLALSETILWFFFLLILGQGSPAKEEEGLQDGKECPASFDREDEECVDLDPDCPRKLLTNAAGGMTACINMADPEYMLSHCPNRVMSVAIALQTAGP